MKRVGNLYDSICDLDTIKYAIKMASQGKTKRHYIKKVLRNVF
ncbi:MAG: DnaD domain protein [Campylobacter sp.]|nr:DnaD domain protein [Campylobacter sp.]